MVNRAQDMFHNICYFPQVVRLYTKYLRNLEDDFSRFHQSPIMGMLELIEKNTPHFYLVLTENEVCGFFCLEHLIGGRNKIHSAEVVVCFDRKYWGTFTKYAAKEFQKFCFEILGLCKIKAIVYTQNFRVKAILNSCGFEREALLKGETRKNNRLQDVEVYSVFNTRECFVTENKTYFGQ